MAEAQGAAVAHGAMTTHEPLIRNVSDTALWAAAYRARETERPDALFRDPLARRLAGERGERSVKEFPGGTRHAWAWVTRTWLFDHFINRCLREGADGVINLAAGLDARPFRMEIPATQKWYEVDLPDLLAYKEEVLRGEKPRCSLERIPMDLSVPSARTGLFERLGGELSRALIITEGLLIYLSEEGVGSLARDLAAQRGFKYWIIDLASPGLLRMMQKQLGGPLKQAGAPLKFAPQEGPSFFLQHGWRVVEVRSMLKTAAEIKRLSFWMRLMARLPDSGGSQPSRPWSGICLLEKMQ